MRYRCRWLWMGALVALAASFFRTQASPDTNQWSAILREAGGQTVYWNAWAGDERINRYIEWAAGEAKRQFGFEVKHVKLADTGEAVTRVLAEKAAGRNDRGSVDLIWINGENFAALKRNGLLFGPFVE